MEERCGEGCRHAVLVITIKHRGLGHLGASKESHGSPAMTPEAPLVRSSSLATRLPFETLGMEPEPWIPCGHKYNLLDIFLISLCKLKSYFCVCVFASVFLPKNLKNILFVALCPSALCSPPV